MRQLAVLHFHEPHHGVIYEECFFWEYRRGHLIYGGFIDVG
jgi:hypothetical protein